MFCLLFAMSQKTERLVFAERNGMVDAGWMDGILGNMYIKTET